MITFKFSERTGNAGVPFFKGKGKGKSLSCVQLFATPWTIQSTEFSRPEFPSPGDILNPGIEARSPTSRADSLPAEPQGKPYGFCLMVTSY